MSTVRGNASATGNQVEKDGVDYLLVKCGNKQAEFYPNKFKKSGKSISCCILYNGRWISPPEFESQAGLYGRKWRQNIKYDGKPVGKWLSGQDLDFSSQRSASSTPEPVSKPVNNVKTRLEDVNIESHNERDMSQTRAEDISVNIHTPTAGLEGLISHELESKLTGIIKSIVERAVKDHFKKEMAILAASMEEISSRVVQLEESLKCGTGRNSPQTEGSANIFTSPDEKKEVSVSQQNQLTDIKLQLVSLSRKQEKIEAEKEKEKRKCNLIIGNVQEKPSESATEATLIVFSNILKTGITPTRAVRLGNLKSDSDNRRPILITLKSVEEKISILKLCNRLRDSGIFIREDLPVKERMRRRTLVKEMKKARNEGKRAFIRYTDGQLIIDGELHIISDESQPNHNTLNTTPESLSSQA